MEMKFIKLTSFRGDMAETRVMEVVHSEDFQNV